MLEGQRLADLVDIVAGRRAKHWLKLQRPGQSGVVPGDGVGGAEGQRLRAPVVGTVVAPLIDVVETLAAEVRLGVDAQRFVETVLGTYEGDQLFDIVVDQGAGGIEIGGARALVGARPVGGLANGTVVGVVGQPMSPDRGAEGRVAAVGVHVPGAPHAGAILQMRLRLKADTGFGSDVRDFRVGGINVDEFDQIFLVKLKRCYDAGVVVTRAPQCRDGDVFRVHGLFQGAVVHREVESAEVVPGHEVGHAGHRVGAEGRRTAVQQQLGALHRDAGHDGIYVGAVPTGAVCHRIVDGAAAV